MNNQYIITIRKDNWIDIFVVMAGSIQEAIEQIDNHMLAIGIRDAKADVFPVSSNLISTAQLFKLGQVKI